MILRIIPEVEATNEFNVKTLDYKTFNFPEYHFFIATNVWESIEVYLKQKGIKKGYLSQVITKTNKVRVKLLDEVNEDILFLLRELYPEYSPYLRREFFNGKDNVVTFLKEKGVLI